MIERYHLPRLEGLVSRRGLLRGALGVSAMGLLAACGGDDDDDEEAGTGDQPDPTPTEADDVEPTPTSDQVRTGDGETRTVEHALGTTEVPPDPQRVVAVTGTVEVDALVALGVKPIAAAELEYGLGFSEQATPYLDGVTMLPTRREIDLELVATQEPDLIIGTQGWLGDIYDLLSEIAPTVAIDDGGGWRSILEQVAVAVGREDQAAELIEEVDAAIEQLADEYAPQLDGLTYTLVKPFPSDGEYGLYYLEDDIDRLLQRLGMVRTDAQMELFEEAGSYYAPISLERVDILDTDVVLLFGYSTEEDIAAIETTLADPLFSRLDAVQQGNVFSVDSAHWYFSSPLAMQQVLADLSERILPQIAEAE